MAFFSKFRANGWWWWKIKLLIIIIDIYNYWIIIMNWFSNSSTFKKQHTSPNSNSSNFYLLHKLVRCFFMIWNQNTYKLFIFKSNVLSRSIQYERCIVNQQLYCLKMFVHMKNFHTMSETACEICIFNQDDTKYSYECFWKRV